MSIALAEQAVPERQARPSRCSPSTTRRTLARKFPLSRIWSLGGVTLTLTVSAHSLVNILKAAKQDVPEDLLKFGTTVKKKAHDSYGAFYKDVDMTKKATKITF